MQYFNNSSNHLKAIKMFSSNHLMKNSLLLRKSLTNRGFYSLHKKCFNNFFGSNSCQNRHKLLVEYKAVLRTLRNSNLLVLSSNDCFYKWIHSSNSYNNNQNKNPKNGTNNKNKSQTNSSHDNDNEDNKEDEEPKSSLLAKAAIWMLTGFVTSFDLI